MCSVGGFTVACVLFIAYWGRFYAHVIVVAWAPQRARAKGILVLAIYNQLISVTQGHCHFARAGLHSRASPPARHPAAHVRGVSRSQLPALTHWPLVTQRARCEHSRELPVL